MVIWQQEGVAPAGVAAVSWGGCKRPAGLKGIIKLPPRQATGYSGCEQQTTDDRSMHAPRRRRDLAPPNEPSQRVNTATRRDPSCYGVTTIVSLQQPSATLDRGRCCGERRVLHWLPTLRLRACLRATAPKILDNSDM